MRWLHFCDFHLKGSPGAQDDAMQSLVNYVDSLCANEPIDVVFFTGDLSFSGKKEEFSRFEQLVLHPLRNLDHFRSTEFYAVPGNHDVDCDAANPTTWEAIRPRMQAVYFLENEAGVVARDQRARVFQNYHDFTVRNGISSPDPFREVSRFFACPGLPVDILLTNTSFFSDKEEDSSSPITPCPLPSLRERLTANRGTRPILLVGHHSPASFLPSEQKPFQSLLIDKHLIYLHGHEHAPAFDISVKGTIQRLGFGASYIVPLGRSAPNPYRNSFTLCTLKQRMEISSFTWDPFVGRWDDSTRIDFSGAFTSASIERVFTVPVPLLETTTSDRTTVPSLRAIPRKVPQVNSIAVASAITEATWLQLVNLCENVKSNRTQMSTAPHFASTADGKNEFVLEDVKNRDLFVCIPGASHILSAKEIESYNTRLDTEGLRSVSIVSLGKISSDASVMYNRLRTRKPIEVLVNRNLADRADAILSREQLTYIEDCDAADVTVDLLLCTGTVLVLITRSRPDTSFEIVNASGQILDGTNPLVTELRERNSRFAKMPYSGGSSMAGRNEDANAFDEDAYLADCYEESNVLKYAALANVGLRFSEFSLDKVYIEGSAAEVDTGGSDRLDSMVEDHLANYPASEALKQQIKQQLLQGTAMSNGRETSQAREYCQKFSAVLLTGDPGSGKTCFTNREILSYCQRSSLLGDGTSKCEEWHSIHVPVLVSLSQAAAESDLSSSGLLKVASRLLERRGLHLPHRAMEDLLHQGRLAFFFDGLDEVVSVEKRALVVQKINELITNAIGNGNRIVVTSRPAAVNVVNLLPSLKKLELVGLSESEISTLARRVLSLKVADTESGVIVDSSQSDERDSSIVRQLLDDCREKPGVARLAQNPLLLTLLVMIYANSGAPSAKKHLIYDQAIRTLASVRGRTTGHDPVSAQDLRERLGAVALSVYRKESGILPTRAEVREVIRTVMERQRRQPVAPTDADRFIQKIAESTGLIALSGDVRAGDDAAVVTFMHHSFMEYFAAVGLSRELDSLDLPALVVQPRWREILTLLSGIIGESTDIAPVLARIIPDGSEYDEFNAKLLIFSIECALECDVPSEAAVSLLCRAVSRSLTHGPAKCDKWVRSEIGRRFEQLVSACGLTSFEPAFEELLRFQDADSCAAALEFVGYACATAPVSSRIVEAVQSVCKRTEERVLCAICDAAARVSWFRTPLVLQIVGRCFDKTEALRISAFTAAPVIPGFVMDHWSAVINGLDDTSTTVRRLASRAAIRAGLDGDMAAAADAKKEIVANAFQVIYEDAAEAEYPEGSVRRETIDRLMTSPLVRDRQIGIQLLPAMQGTPEDIHNRLFEIIERAVDHREVTAALFALRSSRNAQVLITVGEVRRVSQLTTEGTSDVRRAAIYLLAQLGSDARAVETLLDRDFASISVDEYQAVLYALGRSQANHDQIVGFIEHEIKSLLLGKGTKNKANVKKLCSSLSAAEVLGKSLSAEIATAVSRAINDFRVDEAVRSAALTAYPAIAVPSRKVVDFLTSYFSTRSNFYTEELVRTPGILAKSCRQNVDYIVACVDAMSGLKNAAVQLHGRLRKKPVTLELENMIGALRSSIDDISQIIETFDEFIKSDSQPTKR